MKALLVLFVVGMWLLTAAPAAVAESNFNFYLGGSIGKTELAETSAIGASVHRNQLAQWDLTQVSEQHRRLSPSNFSYSGTLGTNFGRYVSVELSLFGMEPETYSVSGRSRADNGNEFDYEQTTDIQVSGRSLSLVGRWPLRPRWQVYGRAGMSQADYKANGALCGGMFQDCKDAVGPEGGRLYKALDYKASVTNPYFGLGVLFGGTLGNLRVEYTAYRTRTPRDMTPDPLPSGYYTPAPSIEGAARSATMHMLSVGFAVSGNGR